MTDYVCLDTNAWFGEELLRSAVGAAVLYAASTGRIKILLPEIVERELSQLVVRTCRSLLEDADECHRRVGSLLAKRVATRMPTTDEHLRRAFDERLEELAPYLHRVQTPAGAYAAAFDRVIKCQLPNSNKNQQAKDSLLWESLLLLETESLVHFVTADKAFYAGQLERCELAQDLALDAAEKNLKLELVPSCAHLLSKLGTIAPQIDLETLRQKVWQLLPGVVETGRSYEDLQDVSLVESTLKVETFFTTNPNELAITFTVRGVAASAKFGQEWSHRLEGRAIYYRDRETVDQAKLISFWGPHGGSVGATSKLLGFDGFSHVPDQAPELLIPFDRVQKALGAK